MNDIKLTRRVVMPKQYEFYEIEMTVTDGNILYAVKALEQQVRDVEDFILGKIKLPKATGEELRQPVSQQQPQKKTIMFDYEIIGNTVHYTVPYDDKDTFKEVVKKVTGRWPKWDLTRKTWNIPDSLLSMALDKAFEEAGLLEGHVL